MAVPNVGPPIPVRALILSSTYSLWSDMQANHKLTSALALSLFGTLTAGASGQITVIATESFDYVTPALFLNQSGGTGWAGAWDVPGMGNEVVVFDTTVNPPMTCADSTGNYAGQALEFNPAIRQPDWTNHGDILDGSLVGADGSTVWISFRTQQYQVFGDSFGALQLFQTASPGNEQLLLGSPWATNAWGLDDEGGVGLLPEIVGNTNAAVCASLVFRIDHLPGDERIRLWVDPATAYPTTPADLDTMITDLRWDEIRLNSGGSGTHFFWDEIEIAKGEPSGTIGTNYCGPAVLNSSGQPAVILVQGSTVAADNNIQLISTQMPLNSFGYSLTSQAQGFTAMPGTAIGNLCLAGNIGRYIGPGQIMNSGAAGEITLTIDLTQTPTPTGLVSVQPGQTWYFQTWFRDVQNGLLVSNFTDGTAVMFQ